MGDMTGASQVKDRMGAMVKRLERDPQVESLLRGRRAELGLPSDLGRCVGQGLSEYLGIGRGRGHPQPIGFAGCQVIGRWPVLLPDYCKRNLSQPAPLQRRRCH